MKRRKRKKKREKERERERERKRESASTAMDVAEIVKAYERDGYAVIPNFLSKEEVDRLRVRALELADGLPASEWDQRWV
jgi:hypothetical protein